MRPLSTLETRFFSPSDITHPWIFLVLSVTPMIRYPPDVLANEAMSFANSESFLSSAWWGIIPGSPIASLALNSIVLFSQASTILLI